ncbi:MAG: flagellar hook-basal body protein [Defluviitaleaceae bacterium]|nr:flagellar hook-basal body protein [Defluviitaleaceae bacterium]
MIRGLYTSAMGMSTQAMSLDVVSNNLANASTIGFRNGIAVRQSFPEMLMKSIQSYPGQPEHDRFNAGFANFGVMVSDIHVDFSQGTLNQTSGELDLAIVGGGFFAVESLNRAGQAQEMFTRAGAFTLTPDRTLVNFNGDRVLNEGGAHIIIPDGNDITISSSGEIFVDGTSVDTIRIVDFEDTSLLRPFGHTLLLANGAVEIPFTGQISQGYLERSNVNVMREMVNMINIARAYEFNQNMVSIQNQTLQQAVNDIARR